MSASLDVALTGATGFIGRRLARALIARGHKVRAIVRDQARAKSLASLAGCELVPLSLDAKPHTDTLRRALDGASTLCHVAAYIPANQRDPNEAQRCLEVNALATLALVEASIAAKCPRLVYFSSGNIYEPSPSPVTERAATYPSSRATFYLASKLCGELYVDHARRSGALATAVLRVSSVYGPGMSGGVVPLFVGRMQRGERVTVSDGGRYRTDLVYVDDVVRAAVSAIERSAASGPINVGSGAATTLADLARAVATLTGRGDESIVIEPEKPGPVDLGFSALDVSLARALLAYEPTPLADGLRAFLSEPAAQ
ncbi:MAG: NAD(P)-dependent oxidoreductase [Myxococcales bacterium]|nr:NAD(P)-dependent oxidoreductase [Myxococcales bacterium]